MAVLVVTGAALHCSFGAAPSILIATPTPRVLAPTPTATIMDFVPTVNIPSFAMCTCPANPMVVAETAAAFGVPTPAPCIPATLAPWIPGAPTVLLGGFPALDNLSQCICAWGGLIQILEPGQVNVEVE